MDANASNPHDFPFISVGGNEDASLLEGAAAGSTTILEETVYRAAGASGMDVEEPPIGVVTIVHWKGGRAGRIPFTAYFALGGEGDDDPEVVIVSGMVPGNGTWRGRGRGVLGGGTGKFDGRTGTIPIESTNPKRWG